MGESRFYVLGAVVFPRERRKLRMGAQAGARARGLAADLVQELDLAVVARALEAHGEAPQAGEVAHDLVGAVAERTAAEGGVAQGE